MNHAWIAALLPLFLSPQSDQKPSSSGDDAAKCEKACQEMKEKMKACKDLARKDVQKAMEVARKAAQDGMRGAHEAMQQAHQELERALQSAKSSGWWDGKKLRELQLSRPLAAYEIGQDGVLTRIDPGKNLQELAEELRHAQGEPSADRDDDPDDEMDSADEAAEEASTQAEEAAEAAEHAQEEAAQESQEAEARNRSLDHIGYAGVAGEPAGGGQSRGLEKRISALEHRLGVHSDESSVSLEERVAALERLAMRHPTPHPAPQPLVAKTPRPPHPNRWFAMPRTPSANVAPPAPEAPRVYLTQPGQAWSRPSAPQPDATPVPPRAAEVPPALVIRRAPADMRREIETRMRKMREEMERLREEMNRLRDELGRQGGEDR